MNSDSLTTHFIKGSPNQKWTPRWVDLRPHAVQLEAWNSPARFKLLVAGRRSGKTELTKRRIAIASMVRKSPAGRYFAAAPTYGQAKRIWWDDLKAMIDKGWRRRVSESELYIQTTTGAQIWVVGLDQPARIEGTPWDGGAIDEFASCKPGIWDANIRPALADRRGWCWLLGVPDFDGPSQEEYHKKFMQGLSGNDPEWRSWSWPSTDILPPEEVESARAQMDPRLFEQEMLGRFVMRGSRAFPDFDPSIDVQPCEYDPALPLCWTLDFNIDPMCSGIIQHHKGHVRVLDEMVLPHTQTKDAVAEFRKRCFARNWSLNNLQIYGDASGRARDSTSGTSDWAIIRQLLPEARQRVPNANPPVKDTINAVNLRILSAAGERHLRIDPRCERLISDLRNAPAFGDLEPQHCLAWLRYFIVWEYPVIVDHGPSKIGLG
jgi:hypothetical protein